jgi:hypothetical protein
MPDEDIFRRDLGKLLTLPVPPPPPPPPTPQTVEFASAAMAAAAVVVLAESELPPPLPDDKAADRRDAVLNDMAIRTRPTARLKRRSDDDIVQKWRRYPENENVTFSIALDQPITSFLQTATSRFEIKLTELQIR